MLNLSSLAVASPLSASVQLGLAEWLAAENKVEIWSGHRSQALMRKDAEGEPFKTEYAVVVMSGLYNSPSHMDGLAKHFFAKDMNVLNVRLHGHYEIDGSSLASTVKWTEWLAQARSALTLARGLGSKIILIGHSTGGVLLTWAATESREHVVALGLFAPAFRVHPVARTSARILEKFGLTLSARERRQITGHAARQVDELSLAFAREARPFAAERLTNAAVWIGHTGIDVVIERTAAREFLNRLRPSEKPRVEFTVPVCRFLLHDRLISPKTRSWPDLLRSLDQTLLGGVSQSRGRP